MLLPNYIGITDREGSGIFDPVTTLNLEFGFYLLEDDLSIDLDKLSAAVLNSDFKVVLLVHYFGLKIGNLKEAVLLCKSHDLIVVEDCAHLYNYELFELSEAGTLGDFAFYSLHKNFPLAEGGMLMQNNLELPLAVVREKAVRDLASKVYAFDSKSIAQKRVENFRLYEQLIPQISGISALRTYTKGDIPHNFPVVIENDLRERLYFWLIDQGVRLIALYYRLIDPILASEAHKNMHSLANDILNLPVDQSTDAADIKKLLELMNKGIKELNQ